MVAMTILSFLEFFCLLSAFTTCALGFFVFAKNPGSRINRLFLAAMIGASYWALGEFFIWQAGTLEGTWFWLKASAFWPVVVVLTVHFVLALTDHPLAEPGKPRLLLTALYVLAIGFSFIGVFTDAMYDVVFRPGAGYVYIAKNMDLPYLSASIFIVIVMFWAIVAGASTWRSAKRGKKQRQVQFVCAGILTAVTFGALSGVILPAAGIFLPNLVFIGIVIFSLFITYAITRYGLFTLSTETAIPDILRTMPDGLLLVRPDGRIIATNAATAGILHTPDNELAGRLVSAFIPEEAYTGIMEAIHDRGIVLDYEVLLDKERGTVVSIAGSQVIDPGGESAGIVLIVRDISSRKEQERELRVANEKISLVTRLTRHDINNLVTALAGYLLLLEECQTGSPGDEYVRTTLTLVDRISRQLRFSSEFLNIGTYKPDWQSLENLVSRAESDLPHDGVTITTDLPPVEIYGDPLWVKVVYNILENAIRHGIHISKIAVSARPDATGDLLITIEDDGGGVPVKDKDEIFKYGVGKHTGLGLAFTRDILMETGITIAETGTEGIGARFEIRVPASSWRSAGL
jgi:PAS domain S-box-containing protein